ncbi:MAG: hypothetical protein EOM26_02830 [Alphaproteobacteria bacterium]|nr:hypothetical protein [Alphaproteobacteria bacterium]
MELLVTKSFLKILGKNPQLREAFETKAQQALSDPTLVREKKEKGIYSLDLPGGRRVLLAKDRDGNLIPFFAGSHADYDALLAKHPTPDKVLIHVTRSEFEGVTGPFNRIGAVIGQSGGSETQRRMGGMGRHGAVLVAVLAGALSYLQTGDVDAAMGHIMPDAEEMAAPMDPHTVEAVLQQVDDLPLGKAAANFVRPLVLAAVQPGGVSSFALGGAAQNVLVRLGPPAIGSAAHLDRRYRTSTNVTSSLEL